VSPPAAPKTTQHRTIVERRAVRQLEVALIEQARVGDLYARAVGTSAEQAAYRRLQASSQLVSERDAAVKSATAQRG
jgi:hypothetical protein